MAPCVGFVFREMGVSCEVDLLFDGDDLLDQSVFGEALYRSLLVDAVDSAAVRVENRAVGIEVVAEDAFGDDFFSRALAADQFPAFWDQRRSAVVGTVGGLVGIEHVAPDHHLADVGVFLAGIAGGGQRVSRVAHGKEIQKLKKCVEQTEREENEIDRGAPRAGRLIGVAIGAADVVERAVVSKLRCEQVEPVILGERGQGAGFEIEFVDGEWSLRDGESGAIASDGGRLEDELAGRAGNPVRSVINGVALRDVAHVSAVGAHHGDAGLSTFTLDYARQRILCGACGEAADAEVGGVEEAEFVGGAIAEEEDSADVVGGEAVEKLAGVAAGTDAGDVYADVGGIAGMASPEDASGHEFRAGALGLPGVAIVNLGGALADGFSEFAIDGADGIIAQFEVELALRQVGVGMVHSFCTSLAEGNRAG
jgi:hypothetical protein